MTPHFDKQNPGWRMLAGVAITRARMNVELVGRLLEQMDSRGASIAPELRDMQADINRKLDALEKEIGERQDANRGNCMNDGFVERAGGLLMNSGNLLQSVCTAAEAILNSPGFRGQPIVEEIRTSENRTATAKEIDEMRKRFNSLFSKCPNQELTNALEQIQISLQLMGRTLGLLGGKDCGTHHVSDVVIATEGESVEKIVLVGKVIYRQVEIEKPNLENQGAPNILFMEILGSPMTIPSELFTPHPMEWLENFLSNPPNGMEKKYATMLGAIKEYAREHNARGFLLNFSDKGHLAGVGMVTPN